MGNGASFPYVAGGGRSSTPDPPVRGSMVGGHRAGPHYCVGCSRHEGDPIEVRQAKGLARQLVSQERFRAPVGWQWGHFRNVDGAQLRYGWSQPKSQTDLTAVLLPAYQSPAEALFETARDLLNAGIAVWVLDWRGQGGSERWLVDSQKSYSIGLDRDARDLFQFTTRVVERPNDTRLVMIGESLGGLIGFRVLHDHPGLFRAAAFSSPAIRFKTGRYPEWLVRGLSSFVVTSGMGQAYMFGQGDWKFDPGAGERTDPISDDRARAMASQGWLLLDPNLRQGGATYSYIHALFGSSDMEQAPGWMESIGAPVLIGEDPDDHIASASAMERACARLPHCTLAQFPGTRHALFSDADPYRARWIRILVEFLRATTSPSMRGGP